MRGRHEPGAKWSGNVRPFSHVVYRPRAYAMRILEYAIRMPGVVVEDALG